MSAIPKNLMQNPIPHQPRTDLVVVRVWFLPRTRIPLGRASTAPVFPFLLETKKKSSPSPLLSLLSFENWNAFRLVCNPHSITVSFLPLRVLNDHGLQALGLALLDVDGLHVAVQLLLGALLVVTLAADAHAQAERHTLDARLPDFLVQLRVEADVAGSLYTKRKPQRSARWKQMNRGGAHSLVGSNLPLRREGQTYHSRGGKLADLLDRARGSLLEAYAVNLLYQYQISLPSKMLVKKFWSRGERETLDGGGGFLWVGASHSGGLHKTDLSLSFFSMDPFSGFSFSST